MSLQGLPSGNFSFQVKAIDAAGNCGEATENYPFSVDSRIKDSSSPGVPYWGLGWKFWLIVGGGSFSIVAVIVAMSVSTAIWLKRRRPNAYQAQENVVSSDRTLSGNLLCLSRETSDTLFQRLHELREELLMSLQMMVESEMAL